MGSVISQNHQTPQPAATPHKKKAPAPKPPTLLELAQREWFSWTLLADALGIDPRNSQWLRKHGIPHRKAGPVLFISGLKFRQWIEEGSTSSDALAES